MKKIIYTTMLLAAFANAAFSQEKKMSNKELVRTALTEVFVKGNTAAIDKYWAPDYIQHNPQVATGRDGLKKAFGKPIPGFKYEIGTILADGDMVAVHARISGWGPKPMIAVDIFRIKNGMLAEHWDVLQEEVPADQTMNKVPMFPIK